MALSLTDLTTPLTVDDVKRSIYSVLAATGVTTTSWKPGAVVRTLISGVSIVGSSLSQLVALLAQSGFLATATGDWLALKAISDYNVTPIPATFATTSVTLTNNGGGIYPLDAGDLQVINPTTHQVYFNLAPVTIPANSFTTTVVQAFQSGSVGTAYPGEINTFQTTGLTGVTVTNPTIALGTDAESDPSIRQRCLDKLGALSPNGPADAYAYIARSAVDANGSALGITRVRVTNDGYGHVDVYLATAGGAVAGPVTDPTSPLGIVDDLLQRQAAPLAITLNTHSATTVPVNISYTLWIYNTSGMSDDQIKDVINANLVAFLAVAPIGGNAIGTDTGKIYQSAIEAAIGSATTSQGVPLTPLKVVVASPGDISLAPDQVPTIGTVTGVVNQLKAPGI